MPTPPAPGSTQPGELYIDSASRALWLGVEPAVDPAEVILISDILAIQPAIDTSVAALASATATALSGKANTVHTHTSEQITDFEEAVEAVIGGGGGGTNIGTGGIIIYHGSMANIGVGEWAGWALCDGNNGTPDLRDRFVLGAGNKPTNTPNSLTFATSSQSGAHTPIINGTALTTAQLPPHAHSATLNGSGSGVTDNQGSHTHSNSQNLVSQGSTGSSGVEYKTNDGFVAGFNTNAAGLHAHNVSVNVTVSGSTNNTGSGSSHTHTAQAVPNHTHTLASSELREAIPFLALAYIMKL